MIKKIMALITLTAILLSVTLVTVSSSTLVIDNNFYQSGGWNGAGTLSGDVLSITNTTSNAQGRINHFTNLDTSANWSGSPNDGTKAAMDSNRIILRTRMSLASIKESGITSQLNLVDTAQGYTASTYLVQLKSSVNSKYDVYVNTDSNGKTEPSTRVLQDVANGTFVNVLVDMYKSSASAWTVNYYINGVYSGTATMTSNTPTNATGLRFRLSNGTVAGTIANFSDFTMIAYSNDEVLPEFAVVSTSYEENQIEIKFTTEISTFVAETIFVNGLLWEDSEIGKDQKSIKLYNLPQEAFTLSVYDACDVLGTVITPYEESFGGSEPEEYIPPVFYSWVPYENFSDWGNTFSNWTAGLETTTPDSSVGSIVDTDGNKSLKLLTKGSGSGMNRINKYAKGETLDLLSLKDTPYTLVIKSRTAATAYGANSSSNEISLATGTSTKQRLFEVTTTSAGEITPKVHGNNMLEPVNLNEWTEVIITAKVKNGNADFNYYINGEKISGEYSYSVADNGINAIQFAQRGYAEGLFDDTEVYLFTGSNPEFTFNGLTDAEGETIEVLDTQKSVKLNFSSVINKKSLIENGILINGNTVDASRITLGGDMKSIVLSPNGKEWDSLTEYVVTVTGITDIFGTALTEAAEPIKFTTGGWKLSASNGGFSKTSLSNGTLTAGFDIKNVSGNDAKVNIVLAQCKGTRDKYMITKLSESSFDVPNDEESYSVSASIFIEDYENSFVMAFVYDGVTYRPVLKEPLILE